MRCRRPISIAPREISTPRRPRCSRPRRRSRKRSSTSATRPSSRRSRGSPAAALQRQGAFVNCDGGQSPTSPTSPRSIRSGSTSASPRTRCRTGTRSAAKGQVVPPANQNYEVDIVLPGGVAYSHQGKISFADPSFSQDTGSFLVRAVLPNPKMELRPGMFVTANLNGAMRPNAIVVPAARGAAGQQRALVYVVNQATSPKSGR